MLKHLFLVLAMAFTTSIFAQPTVGSAPTATTTEIDQLITALDADKFLAREAATQDLANLGFRALLPIADHFFDASTESAWRVKRVLTQIGTQSADQETSLKAIGILMILDDQHSNLESLIETWKVNRSKRAIGHLVSKGAAVIETNRFGAIPRQVFQVQDLSSTGSNPLRTIKRPNRLDPKTAKMQIQDLVSGDLDEVQKFVFQQLPGTNYASSGNLVDREVQIQLLRALNQQVDSDRKVLEIGKNWTGNSTDLQRLNEIHDLSSIRFDSQTLSREDLKTISKLNSIQHVSLARTKISRGHLYDIQLPASVNSIELADQDLENETLRWLASYRLSELTLEDCRISTAASGSIMKMSDLEILNLRRMKISAELFTALARMPSLRRVMLTLCKFNITDYRRVVAARSQLIQFTPVSFLGVQGSRLANRVGGYTCEIELVVPGSGADKAGVKAGDIIESVNDQKVQTFNDLRMFISQHDIGEEMHLQVKRGDEQLELTAKLGENENQSR